MKKRFLLLNFLLFIIYSFNLLAINFSTKKLEKYILMEDMTSGKTVKEEKIVESIDIEHRYILDAMTEATASEILDKYVYKSN